MRMLSSHLHLLHTYHFFTHITSSHTSADQDPFAGMYPIDLQSQAGASILAGMADRTKRKSYTRERDVEQYLVQGLEKIGIPCLKFIPSNKVGMPDRVCLLPNRQVLWVELKTDGGKLALVQKLRHKELAEHGQDVRVVWSKADADNLVLELSTNCKQLDPTDK